MSDLRVNLDSSAVIILHWHHIYKWVFTSLLDAFPSSLFQDAKHGYTTNLPWLLRPKDEQRLLEINKTSIHKYDWRTRLHDRAVEITHLFPNRDQEALCGDRKIMYLVNIPQLWFSLTRPHLSMFTCRSCSLWAPGTDTDSYFSLVPFKTLPRCSFHCKHRWAVITAHADLRQCLRQDSRITITWNELRHFGWFSGNDYIIF